MPSGRVGKAIVLTCFFTAGYGRHRKLGVGFRTAGYGRHRSQWVNSTKLNFHALPKINLVRMLPLVFLENDGKFVILSVWIHINCTALWSTGYVANLFPLFLAYARQAHPMLNCIDEVKKISDLRGPADLWVTSLMTKNVGWCLQFKLPSSWSFWEL